MRVDEQSQPPCFAALSAEQRFVLSLIGYQCPSRQREWLELLPQVDWATVLEVTSADLYPYLHFCLQTRAPAHSCPPEFMRVLADMRRTIGFRNLRTLSQFREIQTGLAQEKIVVVALKGVVLASLAYRDPSLRPMSDVDLFIEANQLDSAIRILRNLGYRCPARFRGHVFDGETKLEKSHTQVLIELHTQIEITAPAAREDPADVVRRAVQHELNGFVIRTLEHQDFLFHLCLHFARRHCFATGLRPLVDILKWVESYGMNCDWASVLRCAQAKDYGTYVQLTLDLARDYLGAPIPEFSSFELLDSAVLEQLAWRQISQDRRLSSQQPYWLADVLKRDSLIEGVRQILALFKRRRGACIRSVEGVLRDVAGGLRKFVLYVWRGMPSRVNLQNQIQLVRERERLEAVLKDQSTTPH